MRQALTKADKKTRSQKIKQAFCAIVAAIVFFSGVLAVYHFSRDKEHRELAERIAAYGPRKGVPRSIDELKKAIAAYEDMQELHVKDAAQTATYWKILGTRFQDKMMYFEAVKAFRRGIEYTPDDEVLHYLTAVNASQGAKSLYDYDAARDTEGYSAERYFKLAEDAYKRAIALEPSYTQARYGLAVLYIYELNRPADAVPELLLYMENRSGDADAMFMLARALFMTGRYHESVEWYDKGISLTKDEEKKGEAMANKTFIIDNYY